MTTGEEERVDLRELSKEGTMLHALGMEVLECGPGRVVMRMPVGPAVHQHYGVLHGGASVALAESAASIGTAMNIDRDTQWAVGLEINANHVRAVRGGDVTAVATPLHKGRTSMVWDIRITDAEQRLVCISRCTVAIVPARR